MPPIIITVVRGFCVSPQDVKRYFVADIWTRLRKGETQIFLSMMGSGLVLNVIHITTET